MLLLTYSAIALYITNVDNPTHDNYEAKSCLISSIFQNTVITLDWYTTVWLRFDGTFYTIIRLYYNTAKLQFG